MMKDFFKSKDFTAKEFHKNSIYSNIKTTMDIDEIYRCMVKASNEGKFSVSTIRPADNEIDEEIITYLENQGFKVTQTPFDENGVPVYVLYDQSDFIRYDISW